MQKICEFNRQRYTAAFSISLLWLVFVSPALAADSGSVGPLSAPAFTAYVEPDAEALPVSDRDGITGWSDAREQVVWYGCLKATGRLDLALSLRLPEPAASQLRLTVTKLPRGAVGTLTAAARGGSGAAPATVAFGSVKINTPGCYRFALAGVSKSGATFGDVAALLLAGPAARDARFNLTRERGAPSVHLWYPFPPAAQVEWFYNEVTVETDPLWSYYMACGFHRGYFGIQVNSPTERRIIFSVWDSGKEPADRNRVAPEDRVQLVSKGDGVFAGSFGNEGTGGHSHLVYPWKTGNTYRFLITARPDGGSTIYSGYFYFPEKKQWGLIASFRAPKDGGYLRGLYSFNEDFNGANGQKQRLALFGPQWIKTTDGRWTELLTARFTHTANGYNDRLDRGAGIARGRFYLSNGGWSVTEPPLPYGTEFRRPASGAPPGDIELQGEGLDLVRGRHRQAR